LDDGKYLQWNSETGDIWLIDPEERKPLQKNGADLKF
jgi:hypothetical protein